MLRQELLDCRTLFFGSLGKFRTSHRVGIPPSLGFLQVWWENWPVFSCFFIRFSLKLNSGERNGDILGQECHNHGFSQLIGFLFVVSQASVNFIGENSWKKNVFQCFRISPFWVKLGTFPFHWKKKQKRKTSTSRNTFVDNWTIEEVDHKTIRQHWTRRPATR